MSEGPIISLLRHRRKEAGLSQAVLSERVGVSRQALIAIEAGRQVPSTSLSLQLARALRCRVDDLFRLTPTGRLEAALAPPAEPGAPLHGNRVALGLVDGVWAAHRLPDDAHVAADGVLVEQRASGSNATVEPLVELAELEKNVLVAGCAPLLGVLASRAGRRYRDARASWLPANSRRALELLAAGLVHVAGLHLCDERLGEDNRSIVHERFPDRPMLVVNLVRWRQGLVVARGNPLGLCGVSDLTRPGIRFVRREAGAGARELLGRLLQTEGAGPEALPAGPMATGHAAVARLVLCGAADAGIAIEAAAMASGLDFVPLSEERFDLILPEPRANDDAVARLLDLIADSSFQTEARRLPGYDVSISGRATTIAAQERRDRGVS